MSDEICLLVRADDIGMAHAGNAACIEVYEQGICRSVELMVPCPWFAEAVELLRAHPEYDVGVHLTLTSEWQRSPPGLDKRVHQTARGVAPKAWRFEGEMHEIANTFADAHLPDGFHLAAAQLYARLGPLKDSQADLEGVLKLLR